MMSLGLGILALYSLLSLTSMAGMNLGFGSVFLVFLISVFRKRGQAFRRLGAVPESRLYLKTGAALFATCLLSLTAAKLFPFSYAGHAPEITVHGFLKIWYLLCPLILSVAFSSQAFDPKENLRFVLRIWWSAVLLLLPIGLIQFKTGWIHPQPIPTNPGFHHVTLFFGHHLSAASILIFPAFTALAVAMGRLKRGQPLPLFESATALSGIALLFLSYARTAWLAIPLGIVLILARNLKPRHFAASVVALSVLIGLGSQTPAMKERIQNSMGIQDRFRLWEANIDYFKHRPLTGIGWLKTQEMSEFYFKEKDPANYKSYFWGHAHNNVFEMLGGTGLLGTLAFFAWSLFTFSFALRTRRTAKEKSEPFFEDVANGIFTGLVLLHFNGMTNVTFWEGKVMHQQMFAVGILFMIRIAISGGDGRPDRERARGQVLRP
ncbi:MAG: O-antigen ligase family protein [Proteobacteria bacterium]|nr:O-antigen ligase family protein [Pseudomonadota bacterium]